jgi:hypothetical protein
MANVPFVINSPLPATTSGIVSANQAARESPTCHPLLYVFEIPATNEDEGEA